MATAGVQSSNSPRLPSPPPLTEVQIGSPSVGNECSDQDAEQSLNYTPDNHDDEASATRRVRPGSKAIDMAASPPLIPLAQLDSPFQLQEHLKALHNHYTRPEGSETVFPIHRDIAIQLAEPPEGVDRALWLYELCRFLTMKVNNLIVAFFAENPPCSVQTCPEMQASEWQYLCAVHDPPKTCCAIDYCCHTLDWATNILTSPKHFPSRLTLGSEASGGPQASMRHLINIFRRVYRIFAHAWYKHREVFWQVEGNEGLYIFFKTVCDVYHLMPEDSYTVPAEAEGVEPPAETPAEKPAEGLRVTILRKEDEGAKDGDAGATARRHKHSPSTGSRVATIAESAEDNEDSKAGLLVVKEDAVPEDETEEGEETTIALEAPLGVTEQPNGDNIVIQEQEVNEEPKPEEPRLEEPERTQPEEESHPQSTEEQAEPSQPGKPQTEPETSKPEEEGEPAPATEESSSEPAPEPTPEAAPEPAAEPESKPETKQETKTEEKKEQPAEQDEETKSETEPEPEPAKET
ncbi:Mob1 family protein [Aspergillus chevalieri]|uniref:Mob1 family protein n=1 Tax=Aspergillus chevalieri TaxID=182096 RepID=A0A7R7VPC0_ASPCH|nr:uncharacterized protein ACHE_40927A [Aspergillus chevalieri]BCR88363.1 hypothetical protein ACHE_40927A [Aspergillus chevalieri]